MHPPCLPDGISSFSLRVAGGKLAHSGHWAGRSYALFIRGEVISYAAPILEAADPDWISIVCEASLQLKLHRRAS